MDFCPVCGVTVDVQSINDKIVFVCRNPQCEKFQKVLNETEDMPNG